MKNFVWKTPMVVAFATAMAVVTGVMMYDQGWRHGFNFQQVQAAK